MNPAEMGANVDCCLIGQSEVLDHKSLLTLGILARSQNALLGHAQNQVTNNRKVNSQTSKKNGTPHHKDCAQWPHNADTLNTKLRVMKIAPEHTSPIHFTKG